MKKATNSKTRTSSLAAIGVIFHAIGRFWQHLRNTCEWYLLALPIEGLFRLIGFLDPRAMFKSLRILGVTTGYMPKKDNTYFVMVLYSKGPTAGFLMNLIDAIGESPHNLVLVTNLTLSPLLKAQLSEKCLVLIERKNVGRDFGAYKDGIEYLRRHFTDVERIVLVNDSIFYFNRSLRKLIDDLSSGHDFIGVTETQELHYHVQSFVLSFGKAVIDHPVFIKFWKRYRPIGTRRWAIHQGEVRLTAKLTRAGFRPHILFPAAHLIEHLRGKPVRQAVESVRLLPATVRADVYRSFLSYVGEDQSRAAIDEIEAVAYGVKRTSPFSAGGGDGRLPQISSQATTMDQWSLGILPEKIIAVISSRSQMHFGAFLFMKHLGLPILKRDIFFRQLYSIEDVYQILTDLGEPLRDEVLADMRRTGNSETLRGVRALMYRHGMM